MPIHGWGEGYRRNDAADANHPVVKRGNLWTNAHANSRAIPGALTRQDLEDSTQNNTNIDTALADAYYLGTILYPAAFADVDPVQKADEIYEALLGHPAYAQMAEAFGGFKPLNLSEK